MTRIEVAKLVGVLLAAFPSADVNRATTTAYETELADLDYASANLAVRRLIGSSKFRPSIAEIREAATELANGPRRHGGEAWGDVIKAVGRYGAYRTPVFADPLVERAVLAFGWSAICGSENQIADRARFIELYDGLATTTRRELQLPQAIRLRLPSPEPEPRQIGAILKSLPQVST